MLERLCFLREGKPCGIAAAGQASAQSRQLSQNSVTPKRNGLSRASGRSVKIFPKRTCSHANVFQPMTFAGRARNIEGIRGKSNSYS